MSYLLFASMLPALLTFSITLLGCAPASDNSNANVRGHMLDVSDVFGEQDQRERIYKRFSDRQSRRFLQYAVKGHIDDMRDIVDKGYDINTRGEFGITPIIAYTAYVRPVREDVFKAMIEMGADVTQPLDNNTSLLSILSRSRNRHVLSVLLEAGISPDTRLPAIDSTFLLSAISEANNQLVQDLIHANADVELPSADGQTPLAMARDSGNFEALMMLIQAGADPRRGDMDLSRAQFSYDLFGPQLIPDTANEKTHRAFGQWLEKHRSSLSTKD